MSDIINVNVTEVVEVIEVNIQEARDAYQLAVTNGFVGDRVEWLLSLVGEDGHTPTNEELVALIEPLIPELAPVATSGDYNDLQNLPALFSGSWNDLANKPTLFSGAYADLSGKPSLFSGAYADLSGKPTLFSGAYADLTGKPALATVATTGAYADLSGKPAAGTDYLAPAGNGSSLTGLTKTQVGLGSVENTALSTWTGSTAITTLGSVTTGTFSGTLGAISGATLTGITQSQVSGLTASLAAKAATGANGDITSLTACTSVSSTSDLALSPASGNAINVAMGTATTSKPVAVTQTWSGSGVAFSAFKVNVTDTASASASLLMDLQVGGTSKAKISKAGTLTLASQLSTTRIDDPGQNQWEISANHIKVVSTSFFGWASGGGTFNGTDACFGRDATGRIAVLKSESAADYGDIKLRSLLLAGPMLPGTYTVSTVPSAASYSGYYIDVSNASGGAGWFRSNGANWLIPNTSTVLS